MLQVYVFEHFFRGPHDLIRVNKIGFLTLITIKCAINHQCSACISLLQYMRTNAPGVFCGGDLATFPLAIAKNQLVNIGHWQMAQAHGNEATQSCSSFNRDNLDGTMNKTSARCLQSQYGAQTYLVL